MTDQQWDVVIVGAGSSGLPAAIFAAQRGGRVLQIEADSKIGGTLYLSSGQMSAAGTRIQRELGIEDSPQDHYDDAQRITHNTIDPVLGRLAIDNAAATIDWLIDIGFELAPEAPQCGVTHEPFTIRRYYWGNNVALSVLEVLAPVHEKLVAEGKIDLRLNTRMTRLIEDNGAVVGVEATDTSGATQTFHAANVALTCGGYAANPELWARTNPDQPLCSHTNAFSRGDGILAAEQLGAQVDGGEKYLSTFAGWREDPDDPMSGNFFGLAPNARRVWEIYVDGSGKRFMREDCQSIDYLENSLLKQPNTEMFIVCDKGIWQNAPPICLLPEAEYRAKFGNHYNFFKADTLGELAEQMGVDAGNLKETVATFNQAVDNGKDPEFGREFLLRKIETAPFYAMGARGITVVSPAGINADGQLRVVKADGTPIPNLYAGGEVLGFTRLSGNAFVGGMSLTPALTFGRLLGQELIPW